MFRSAHDALRFAYQTVSQPIVRTSSMNSMLADMMRGARGGNEMTAHDRHAQAAMILAAVERAVDVTGQAYLRAHYGHELKGGECAKAVAELLVKAVMASLPTGMHSRRGIEKLIRGYFGEKIGVAAARMDLKCTNRKYYEYKELVGNILDAIGRRADDAAFRVIEAMGVITDDVAA